MKIRCVLFLLTLGMFVFKTDAKILDTLVIEGLTINSPGVVRNALEIHEKKSFTPADIQESIRKLYSLGLFKNIQFAIDKETDSTVALRLILDENSICEAIEFSGNKKLKTKDIQEKITLKKGQFLNDDILFKNEQILRKLYFEKGYNLVEIKADQIKTKIPGNVIVKFNIKENAKVRIVNITFHGNKFIKTSKLLHKFKTKEHRWWRAGEFKEDVFKSHLDTLMMFYNDRGFLDASVVKDSVWYGSNKKDINIDVTIDEGKKYYAGKFFFTGNKIIETDSLKSKIAMKESKPFQKSRFELTKYMIESAYREEGYLWVQVDDQRSYRGDTIDVTFNINEGRAAIIRRVDIKGNNKTMEKVIRREIALMPGKKYKQSLMMASRQNIFALNYFGDVKPDIVPNEDGTVDLLFDITEKDNIGQLQIGAAYEMRSKFVGTFSTKIPNFRGAGQELGVDLQYGKDKRDVSLSFTEPWAFNTPLSLNGRVFYDWTKYDDSTDAKSYGFVIGAGRSRLKWPDDHFRINVNYQLSYEKTNRDTALRPNDNLKVIEEGYLSRLSFELRRYDLDKPLFPTSGSDLSIVPMIAGLGGDYKYFKGTLYYQHYFPLPYKFVLGSRTKFGLITGLGSKDIYISHTDLFSIGGVYGDGDLRGYPEYEFGGWNSPNEASGLHMFTSTLELRYPLIDQQMYLAGFFDYGNTWRKAAEINLKDVYKGVGVGIRLNLPMIGIMGFDFGWGLNYPSNDPFKGDKREFQWHFLMNRGF